MPGAEHVLAFGEPTGEGLTQVADLAIAFVLASLIGLEREFRAKAAGLRTHTIVGLGAALFVLISKFGFTDVLSSGRVVLDPSRVAAQIVSGIGFIGAGLIFVRRDAVRGLTTAASIWLTAAVGAAAGAGLPVLAAVGTAGHFVVALGYTPVSRRLPGTSRTPSELRVVYEDGRGVLRQVLAAVTESGFTLADLSVERAGGRPVERAQDERGQDERGPDEREGRPGQVTVVLTVLGTGPLSELVAKLGELSGVIRATGEDVNAPAD